MPAVIYDIAVVGFGFVNPGGSLEVLTSVVVSSLAGKFSLQSGH